jgi:hypothetical protein
VFSGFLDLRDYNTCWGYSSLFSLSGGVNNSAHGAFALYSNSSGNNNSAHGFNALFSNTTGQGNTAHGSHSLFSNTTSDANTALGFQSLYYSTGGDNTAVGMSALQANTTGGGNTAVGYRTLTGNTTGSFNTGIGWSADIGTNFTNATAIGANTVVNASNKIRFGNASVTVIEGTVAYTVSDKRFKSNITEDVSGLAFIKKLKPVTYNFEAKKFDEFLHKNNLEQFKQNQKKINYKPAESIRHSGFIAQEVEQAAKQVGYDFNGVHLPENEDDNYSLSYAQFVVPLVKAVQELSAQNDTKDKTITELNAKLEKLQSQVASILKQLNSKDASISYLEQNAPNPSNSNTVIRYHVSSTTTSSNIVVTDVNGRIVKTIALNNRGAGQATINAKELSTGSYFYSLVTDGKKVDTKQMLIGK